MKLLCKFLTAALAVTTLVGCSSSSQEEGPPSDKEFILNVGKGLEARWELADNQDVTSLTTAEQQKAYASYVKAEKNAIGKLKKYEFEDKDLKKAAETYMKGLDLQEEGVQYQGTDDYTNQNKTWTLGYNYRAVAIYELNKDFGLTVSSKYKSDLDDFVSQYTVAKKEVAIQEYVNSLYDSIVYTKDESRSDEYDIYYTATIENTTEYTIDSITIQVDFKDASGVILDQESDYIQTFSSGSKIQSTIDYYELEDKGEPATITVSSVEAYYN